MKSIAFFVITIHTFVAMAHAGPVDKKNTDIALEEKDVIYTGQHDVVKIYASLPLMEETGQRIVFFVEADIKDGSKVDKGLYVINDNSTTKLLEHARDIAGDATGKVFFATNEGIFTYNHRNNNAQKYGHINESIISLAAENNTGTIYALTENHVLFKITENGAKADVDDRVKHAQEISLDLYDTLFYYDEDKNLHVIVDEVAKEIDGLPTNPNKVMFVKPPFGIEGMCLVVDDVPYIVYSNGSITKSEDTTMKRINPTAFSFDAMVVLYFGREKKIYEYNLLEKVLTGIFESISKWFKRNLGFIM